MELPLPLNQKNHVLKTYTELTSSMYPENKLRNWFDSLMTIPFGQYKGINITEIKTFKSIQEHYAKHGKIFVFMGEGQHKIKRKAEQSACMSAIEFIKLNNDISVTLNSANDAGQETSSDSDN